jgi:hypothetical protein
VNFSSPSPQSWSEIGQAVHDRLNFPPRLSLDRGVLILFFVCVSKRDNYDTLCSYL